MGPQTVTAWIWKVAVGRNFLYLLDTNIEANPEPLRLITASLYGGDRETRIQQEILLGIGGIRALKALGITPACMHMNEGHSAFLGLERIRELMKESKLSFAEAWQCVWSTNVFTTHTPVPAGNERFAPALMEKYFGAIARDLGLSWKEFLALGREDPNNDGEEFCLTVLALRMSAYNNAVSRLHGEVSRSMWHAIWPSLPIDEIPITHITNGVHPRTWITHDMIDLLDRYFGPEFHDTPTNLDVWDRIDRVSDEELWRTHERRRERMVAFARTRLQQQLERRGVTNSELARSGRCPLPLHADDQLCAPIRRVQAGGPPAVGPGPAGPPAHRQGAAHPDDLRRQGAPARPGGQGDHQEAGPLRKRSPRGQPHRLPGRLRHDDVPLPRPRAATCG